MRETLRIKPTPKPKPKAQNVLTKPPEHPKPALLRLSSVHSHASSRASFKTASEEYIRDGYDFDTNLDLELTDWNLPGVRKRCLYVELLPPELHYEILSHLEYPDHRQVKNTSHFFRDYVTEHYFEKSRKQYATTLLDRELNGELGTDTRLPCFQCVRLLRKSKFLPPGSVVPTAGQAANGQAAPVVVSNIRTAERRCGECLWGKARRGTSVLVAGEQWTKCLLCGRRKKTHRYRKGRRINFCSTCGFLLVDWRDVFVFAGELGLPSAMLVYLSMCSTQGLLTDSKQSILGWAISAFIVQELVVWLKWALAKEKRVSYTEAITTLPNMTTTWVYTVVPWFGTVLNANAIPRDNLKTDMLHKLMMASGVVNLCMVPVLMLCCCGNRKK